MSAGAGTRPVPGVQVGGRYGRRLVHRYRAEMSHRDLRAVEVMLLIRHREELAGRVLEIGCGAGRVSGYLCDLATTLHAIDLSPRMVEHCRREYPDGNFDVRDLRDLSPYDDAAFDAVVATQNVIDAVGDADRHLALDGIRRVLAAGGLFVFSSHNRAFVPNVHGPLTESLQQLRSGRLGGLVRSVPRMPRMVVNRRRLRPRQVEAPDHAIVNDNALDYSSLQYYICREQQERQLTEHGFELLECLDLDGRPVERGEQRADCPELHYVAVRSAADPA